jgi:hypothetical protein
MFEKGKADTASHLELDSAEEIRCNVLFQSTRYLQGVRRYHDKNVQRRSFNVGDMILRQIQDDTRLHKLNSRWEGSFIVHNCAQGYRPCILSLRLLILGISSIYATFILDQLGHFLLLPGD